MSSKGSGSSTCFDEFLIRLEEAEKVLLYTLQLKPITLLKSLPLSGINTQPYFANTVASFIDDVFEEIFRNCSSLFNEYNFNVFGCIIQNCTDLSILSAREDFWKYMFKQDVLLSAFFRLRKVIGQDNIMTFYEFSQYSTYCCDPKTDSLHGFDYLAGYSDEIASSQYITMGCHENRIYYKRNKSFSPIPPQRNIFCKIFQYQKTAIYYQ